METIGERIKNARKNLGYTQESLANMLYFSDKTINENKFSKDFVTIDNKESMKNILTDLNYKSLGIISKTRMIFNYQNDYEISFDDVLDLGLFIEVKAKNQDITYDDIINVCKHFSMNTKNIKSEKYIELKSHL